ncbi:MAG: RAD55 family ATPase, partial [Candidatus Natronoplasma sp.]
GVDFRDLSSQYFQRTMVPPGWSGGDGTGLFSDSSDTDLLEALVHFLEENAEDNVVIIDSLTDLLTNSSIDNDKLVTIIKGMRRASRKWGGVVYLLLSKDIVERSLEYHIIDSVDGVFTFRWSENKRVSKRQRYLVVDKFMSVLPHLKREKIARFTAEVTDYEGYVVVNYERII